MTATKTYNLFIAESEDQLPNENSCLYNLFNWVIIHSWTDFCTAIIYRGKPNRISFGYTIEGHKTGLDCARFLAAYCKFNHKTLPITLVHATNPIHKKQIEDYLICKRLEYKLNKYKAK